MKIMIIGHSGSGKTVLALTLSEYYKIDVLHIDAVQYQTGWKNRKSEEASRIIEDFLNSHDAWIIDGNYRRRLFNERGKSADVIYYLNYNRFICLYRAIKRRIKYASKTRVSLADGCRDRLNPSFIYWILIKGRTKKFLKAYRDIQKEYKDKLIEFRNPKQLRDYLDKLDIQEMVKE